MVMNAFGSQDGGYQPPLCGMELLDIRIMTAASSRLSL